MSEPDITTRQDLIDRVNEVTDARSSEFVRESLSAVAPELIERLLHPEMIGTAESPIGTGIGASPGVASGEIVTSSIRAMQRADEGQPSSLSDRSLLLMMFSACRPLQES